MVQDKTDIGRYLYQLRMQKRLSLAKVSIHIGINPMALSEIEHGIRLPSDDITRNISNFYDIDENILFKLIDKVPLGAKEELEQSPVLQKTLLEIKRSNMCRKLKDELYTEMYEKVLNLR